LRTKTLAKKIAQFALSRKAHDVTIMDLRKLTDMTDFFVLCSADSDVQVKAVADAIADGTDKIGIGAWHSEGLTHRQWVLIDYVDVVVHVFHKEVRRFYGLEKLWGDAVIEKVEDEPVNKPAAPVKKPAAPAKKTPAAAKKPAATAKRTRKRA
jgi:ribosome-associated protein